MITKVGVVRKNQTKTLKHDILSISETTEHAISEKIQLRVETVKVSFRLQYHDVITNPTWRTAANNRNIGISQWNVIRFL